MFSTLATVAKQSCIITWRAKLTSGLQQFILRMFGVDVSAVLQYDEAINWNITRPRLFLSYSRPFSVD